MVQCQYLWDYNSAPIPILHQNISKYLKIIWITWFGTKNGPRSPFVPSPGARQVTSLHQLNEIPWTTSESMATCARGGRCCERWGVRTGPRWSEASLVTGGPPASGNSSLVAMPHCLIARCWECPWDWKPWTREHLKNRHRHQTSSDYK